MGRSIVMNDSIKKCLIASLSRYRPAGSIGLAQHVI
jgi:hypothetical protein